MNPNPTPHASLLPRLRKLLPAVFLLASSTYLGAQGATESFVLSEDTNAEWKIHASVSDQPASDWNHFDMKVAETTIRSIMPNYLSGDPVNIEEMNRFNKHLVAESVLISTGQIGTWRQDGTLVAVEFAVLPGDPFPAPDDYLPTVGLIQGEDLQGESATLGTMYCYDQAQYDARIATLTAIMGRDPHRPTVWLGDTLHSGASTNKSMRLRGSDNTVVGSVHANGDLLIGGERYTILQAITYGGLLTRTVGGHLLGPISRGPATALPSPAHDAAWYQSVASANGMFFNGDLSIVDDGQGGLASTTGVALGGVVYATGDISVDSSGLSGTVTLIAQGAIDFGGSNCLLDPARDDLLMWSTSTTTTDAVALDGSGCVLSGAVYAPAVEFRVGGSSNALTGRIAANTIKITGSLNTLTDGTK